MTTASAGALAALLTVMCAGPLSGQAPPPLRRTDLPLAGTYRPYRAPFSVRVSWDEESIDVTRQVTGVPVLPGTRISLAAAPGVRLEVPGGTRAGRTSPEGTWTWTAPAVPGIHGIRITGPGGWIHLNVFVMHPATDVRNGALGSYQIGAYRPPSAARGAAYDPPRGFVVATRGAWDVLVSPHVTLGELLCKQAGDPRAVYFTPHLIRKLEDVLDEVNRRGISAPRLTIMSAFRTPAYNRAIGNTTSYSRHLWGDAADIFIDVDGDGAMDDLNGDGVKDVRDARHLAALIDGMMDDPPPGVQPGGLAPYRPTRAHGGFVHVDARGRRARW